MLGRECGTDIRIGCQHLAGLGVLQAPSSWFGPWGFPREGAHMLEEFGSLAELLVTAQIALKIDVFGAAIIQPVAWSDP